MLSRKAKDFTEKMDVEANVDIFYELFRLSSQIKKQVKTY